MDACDADAAVLADGANLTMADDEESGDGDGGANWLGSPEPVVSMDKVRRRGTNAFVAGNDKVGDESGDENAGGMTVLGESHVAAETEEM